MADEKKNNKQDKGTPEFDILKIDDGEYKTLLPDKFKNRKKYQSKDPKKVTAFIPGTINDIFVRKGKKVKEGDRLLTLEAMKMVNDVMAPLDGVVKKVYVKKGAIVARDQLLVVLE